MVCHGFSTILYLQIDSDSRCGKGLRTLSKVSTPGAVKGKSAPVRITHPFSVVGESPGESTGRKRDLGHSPTGKGRSKMITMSLGGSRMVKAFSIL